MRELYFQYNTIIYSFDTSMLKLFRLDNNEKIEITDRKIMRNVRFDSIEVDRKCAARRSSKADAKTV